MANFRRLRAWWGSFAGLTARGLTAFGGPGWTALGLPPLDPRCAGECDEPGCEECRRDAEPPQPAQPALPPQPAKPPQTPPQLDSPPAGHPERLCQDRPLTERERALWQEILGK